MFSIFRLFKFRTQQYKIYDRAYKICRIYFSMHSESEFLKQFFVSNSYPLELVNCHIKMFLHNIHVPSPINDSVNNVKDQYLYIPYSDSQSEKLRVELLVLLAKYFSDINFEIVLVNNFRVGRFSITKMSFLSQCARLLFIILVVHSVHPNTSVPLYIFFTRESQSIAVGAPYWCSLVRPTSLLKSQPYDGLVVFSNSNRGLQNFRYL